MANPNQFNSILVKQPKRNKFNLSYENKLTAQIGRLTPVACYEVVPGDTFSMKTSALVRMEALLAPLMHRVDVYFHNFYVPNRLVWDKWEDFIVQDPEHPNISYPRLKVSKGYVCAGSTEKSLFVNNSNWDYFGLPSFNANSDYTFKRSIEVDALPFRAYLKIYNDYYRDDNLQDELPIYSNVSGVSELSSASNEAKRIVRELLTPQYRAWEKDYFTSALPNTQLGQEVSLPIRGILEVSAFDASHRLDSYSSNMFRNKYPSSDDFPTSSGAMIIQHNQEDLVEEVIVSDSDRRELRPNMGVDLSDAVKVSINELRKTVALQSWLERSFVGGTRYKESILAHYGVLVPDSRLQRAQYLGGGKQPIVVSPVVQTSSTSEITPQGNMAGYGESRGSSNRWKAYFPEHGYVITLMSIMPKPSYQNTLDKMWSKNSVLDFYFPEFAHLGEEEITNKEVFCDLSTEESRAGEQDATFGYAPRYARYKFHNSEVHGEFKDSLSYWTMTRKFANQPLLNYQFVRVTPSEFDNVFAVTGGRADYPFIVQLYHDVRAYRPMPVFATPKLIG